MASSSMPSAWSREEGEKFNVWVAWLNLENLYGQPPGEAAMALFRRALPHVNQKRLYLALLAILQRTERARPPAKRFNSLPPCALAQVMGLALSILALELGRVMKACPGWLHTL